MRRNEMRLMRTENENIVCAFLGFYRLVSYRHSDGLTSFLCDTVVSACHFLYRIASCLEVNEHDIVKLRV